MIRAPNRNAVEMSLTKCLNDNRRSRKQCRQPLKTEHDQRCADSPLADLSRLSLSALGAQELTGNCLNGFYERREKNEEKKETVEGWKGGKTAKQKQKKEIL